VSAQSSQSQSSTGKECFVWLLATITQRAAQSMALVVELRGVVTDMLRVLCHPAVVCTHGSCVEHCRFFLKCIPIQWFKDLAYCSVIKAPSINHHCHGQYAALCEFFLWCGLSMFTPSVLACHPCLIVCLAVDFL